VHNDDLTLIENLAKGRGHKELATELGVSRTAVTARLARIKDEQNVSTTAELLVRFGQRTAFLSAAEALLQSRLENPVGEAEEHVNHVMEGLAGYLRGRAQSIFK
jgi:hypothetical protein